MQENMRWEGFGRFHLLGEGSRPRGALRWEVAERASSISSLHSSRASVTHCWVSALNFL